MTAIPDAATCYKAVSSRDRRFDGVFYTAVATTGIYCRPSCPARTPARPNVTFFPTAAAAQAAGYRACKRCIPDATPGSPLWDVHATTAGRAMRLIADGVVDREGVGGLASHLGYTSRHLTRVLTTELGAGPLALARARRAQTARSLIDATSLNFTEIAFAAGFDSVRQFNDTVRAVYGTTPTQLRGRPGRSAATPGTIRLRLAVRTPFHGSSLLRFLGPRALPGVETVGEGWYARTLRLPHAPGTLRIELPDLLEVGTATVAVELALGDLRDITAAVERARRLVDADCDPIAVAASLRPDPLLGPLVRRWPGLRVPGHVDGAEVAVRAIVGQQNSVAGARTVLGRLVHQYGEPLPTESTRDIASATTDNSASFELDDELPDDKASGARANEAAGVLTSSAPAMLGTGQIRDDGGRFAAQPRSVIPDPDPRSLGDHGGTATHATTLTPALTHLFPTPQALVDIDPADLPMPKARGRALIGLCQALVDGELALDRGPDRHQTRAKLLALPGIGEWTASYLALRALGDPDAFLPTDLGTRHGLARLGADPARATALAETWRPWRSYAQSLLWHVLLDPEGTSHVARH